MPKCLLQDLCQWFTLWPNLAINLQTPIKTNPPRSQAEPAAGMCKWRNTVGRFLQLKQYQLKQYHLSTSQHTDCPRDKDEIQGDLGCPRAPRVFSRCQDLCSSPTGVKTTCLPVCQPHERSQWAGKSVALEEVSFSAGPGQPHFWAG